MTCRRSREESKGQGKAENRDKDVEHPLLGILGADLHHLFGTFRGGAQAGFIIQLDILLDILNRPVGARGHRLDGGAGEPVNHRSAAEEPEQGVGIKKIQYRLRLNAQGFLQEQNQRENHGRGADDRRTDQNRFGSGFKGVAGSCHFLPDIAWPYQNWV